MQPDWKVRIYFEKMLLLFLELVILLNSFRQQICWATTMCSTIDQLFWVLGPKDQWTVLFTHHGRTQPLLDPWLWMDKSGRDELHIDIPEKCHVTYERGSKTSTYITNYGISKEQETQRLWGLSKHFLSYCQWEEPQILPLLHPLSPGTLSCVRLGPDPVCWFA